MKKMKIARLLLLLALAAILVVACPDPSDGVESVTIAGDADRTAAVGDADVTLTATVDGTNNPAQTVTWTSSNEGVATVTADGVVTFLATGSTDITATSTVDTSKSATVSFTVSAATATVTLVEITGYTTTTATAGDADVTLTATVDGTNNPAQTVTWTSSNEGVAKVTTAGVVTFVGAGSADITATSTVDDTKSATVRFTVNAAAATVSSVTIAGYTTTTATAGDADVTLTATVTGTNSPAQTVTWTSSDEGVAKVTTAGVVTFVGAGSADITATSTVDDTKSATVRFTVNAAAATVSSVTIAGYTTTTATVGDADVTLTATVTGTNNPVQTVTWETDNSAVATVTDEGVVTFVGAGSADITATSTVDTSKSATVSFTVSAATATVTLVEITGYTTTTATVGDADVTLTATVTGTNDPATTVTWTSSNPHVATVTDGVVTFVGAGTALITATSTVDTSKSATVSFTVGYGTPASITTGTNDGTNLAFSWDEFGSNASTEYTVYAYNLSIRTASGGTAPTLTEFLANKNSVQDIENVMAPITVWTGLTDPNASDTAINDLKLYRDTKYVFVVTGTRGGTKVENAIAAAIVDTSSTGDTPTYHIHASDNGNKFHIAVIDPGTPNWETAAAFAVAQGGGGKLVEINDSAEDVLIYNRIIEDNSLDALPTTYIRPSDGGGAAYLWIGATDKTTEGTWVWDGDNDGFSTDLGVADVTITTTTLPGDTNQVNSWTPAKDTDGVSNVWDHWGGSFSGETKTYNEPDDYLNNQDAAAVALGVWGFRRGQSPQWNDLNATNSLSGYIMEAEKNW